MPTTNAITISPVTTATNDKARNLFTYCDGKGNMRGVWNQPYESWLPSAMRKGETPPLPNDQLPPPPPPIIMVAGESLVGVQTLVGDMGGIRLVLVAERGWGTRLKAARARAGRRGRPWFFSGWLGICATDLAGRSWLVGAPEANLDEELGMFRRSFARLLAPGGWRGAERHIRNLLGKDFIREACPPERRAALGELCRWLDDMTKAALRDERALRTHRAKSMQN